MLPRNHPDRIGVSFDDHRLVANAGTRRPSSRRRRCAARRWDRHPPWAPSCAVFAGATSVICENYGYTGKRGYHPLLAVAAGTGDVLMCRLREGRANTARGAAHFLPPRTGLDAHSLLDGTYTPFQTKPDAPPARLIVGLIQGLDITRPGG